MHSVEALLRWHHPSRGLLLPEEFLPAAERAGLMRKWPTRTVNLALEQIRSWRDQGIALTVAVNLSTTNLLDLDLVGTIERLLQDPRTAAEALIIEITESTLVDSAAVPQYGRRAAAASASASRWTTTAPDGRLWHACKMFRSTS